jgi:hypothetical protein
MSSLSAKDRVHLCQFTFSDGRRCRTPRTGKNPHFCFDHAQKEARANAAESLGNDLDFFFSADYLSACDLSTALGRLITAVLRGDVKPRTARTVAYLAQTLLQTIHLAKHEYINTFGTDGWRKSIRNSVNDNYDHRFPPAPEPAAPPESPQPQPAPAETPVNCHAERSAPSAFRMNLRNEEPASSSNSPLATHHSPIPQAPQPAPSPQTPLPPTSAEFAQQVMAGHSRFLQSDPVGQTASFPATPPVASTTAKTPPDSVTQPAPIAHSFISDALPPHVRRRLHRAEDNHLL